MEQSERARAEAWWAALGEDRRSQLRELGQDHLPAWAVEELRAAEITLTADRHWPTGPGEAACYPLPGVLRDILRADS
jgi:hypothetical protein